MEGFLKLIFLQLSMLTFLHAYIHYATVICGVAASYLGMTRQIGEIKFELAFLQKLMNNEFGVIIFYFLLSVGFGTATALVWLPVSMYFAIGAAEFLQRTSYAASSLPQILPYCQVISASKRDIKVARGYIEIFSLFYFLLLVIIGKFGFITLFLVGHYVKIKYKVNQFTNYAVNQVKLVAETGVSQFPVVGPYAMKAVGGVFWLITA